MVTQDSTLTHIGRRHRALLADHCLGNRGRQAAVYATDGLISRKHDFARRDVRAVQKVSRATQLMVGLICRLGAVACVAM